MAQNQTQPAATDSVKAEVPGKVPVAPPRVETGELSLPKRIWEGWKRVGLFIGKVNLHVLTFLVYSTVFGFTAIMTIILRRDFLLLRKKKDEKSFWTSLPEPDPSIEKHQRQF